MGHQQQAGLLRLAQVSGWTVCLLGAAYAAVMAAGLLSLPNPDEPIGQPYLAVMEMLILLIAPLMATTMTCLHYCTPGSGKVFSSAATACMWVMAGITSCVHVLVLTFGRQNNLFAFHWPSLVYVLDVLAWDWFYALAMFFAGITLKHGKLEKTARWLVLASGALSLAGLAGVPGGNMQLRNIGIAGYAILGPPSFLLLSMVCRARLSYFYHSLKDDSARTKPQD